MPDQKQIQNILKSSKTITKSMLSTNKKLKENKKSKMYQKYEI